MLSLGVERRLEEVGVGDAGNLDRILEGHEHAFARPLVGIHVEEVVPVVEHLSAGHHVFGMPRQDARQRALAGAVRPHDGVHFAGLDVKIDALEDLLVLGFDLEILDIEHFRTFGFLGGLCLLLLVRGGAPPPPPASARFARAAAY